MIIQSANNVTGRKAFGGKSWRFFGGMFFLGLLGTE
jgi:hypothetical protein